MADKKTLLIVEDDPGIQKQLKWSFSDYRTVIAGDRAEAIDALKQFSPSVATLDLGLPPDASNASEGLKTLQEILLLAPRTKVIVVTGNDERDNAIKAVAMGAYDFYQKPVDIDVLELIVARAFQLDQLEKDNIILQQTTTSNQPLTGLIGTSVQMQSLAQMIEKIAPTQATTLLLGESGTGKEVVAKAIHRLSRRSDKPFIAVNCAAIPENLLESELFGYEKGAFTGASQQTAGKIEFANGGTFFLDEIGDLPFSLQAKLLRFMQERVIEHVGGRVEIPVDVRIICATHQNIEQLISDGVFREDLFYRMNEIVINIPPLRAREGDAIVIAKALLSQFSQNHNKHIRGFSQDAARLIEHYDWPGNVRELENKIKRAVIMTDNTFISATDLEIDNKLVKGHLPFNLKQVREVAETKAIKRALVYADNNVSNAAKLLGITRPTLYALFTKYDIKVD